MAKKFRIVRKSAEWLAHDREEEANEAKAQAEAEARTAPYPAYSMTQFFRQRLSPGKKRKKQRHSDESLLMGIHEAQHGPDGYVGTDDKIAAEFEYITWSNQDYDIRKALKRFRRRGLILPTENGAGIYVKLPRVFKRLPEPEFWPDRRTWKPYVLVQP